MKKDKCLLYDFLKAKRIIILGFGREGQDSLKFIKEYYDRIEPAELGIADLNPIREELLEPYKALGKIRTYTGENYLEAMADFDLVLKSPGISFKDFTILREPGKISLAEYPGVQISSQMDLFLRFAPGTIAGISGTKGKSTTTSLVYEIFKAQVRKEQAEGNRAAQAYLLGNIGVPVLKYWDQYDENAYLACEMSSHQLEFVTASPQAAILTNFYPEHLDHYQSYDQYLEAKLNICHFQDKSGLLVVDSNEEELMQRVQAFYKNKLIDVRMEDKPSFRNDERSVPSYVLQEGNQYLAQVDEPLKAEVRRLVDNPQLAARHQKIDALLATALAKALGVDFETIDRGLEHFRGLPHRLEALGLHGGRYFYNDSIATIPQATLLALESLRQTHPVKTLILGGMDRGISYDGLIEALENDPDLEVLIGLPDTGHKIIDALKEARASGKTFASLKILEQVESMDQAVALAYSRTPEMMAVLLSPAAASYNRYKNFEERGEDYRKWVLDYAKRP